MSIRPRLNTVALIAVGLIWLNNTSTFFVDVPEDRSPGLIAHRGVHHVYAGTDITADTCRAANVAPITHDLIENTLPSMRAAFDAGADVVEVDIHLTTDDNFAVFHDWTLDCQTDGTGETRASTMADLKTLDVGYNITADGTTFPLRGGPGQGAMPELNEVFDADLPGPVLVNFKSERPRQGTRLSDLLQDPARREKVFGVYGAIPPTRTTLASIDGLRGFDEDALRTCLTWYMSLGWSGWVPPGCRNTLLAVPVDYAPYLWGWPHKLTERLAAVNTSLILWGPYDGSGFSSGIDDAETLALVPDRFGGYVWTDRIEVIGPLIKTP